jgi:VanZ family protein
MAYDLITVAYMAILTMISIQPISKDIGCGMSRQILNNILHIPVYGLLTFLLIKSMVTVTEGDCHHATNFKHVYLVSFLIAVSFGLVNEYLQSFVPSRSCSLSDALLNAAGSLIVVITMSFNARFVIARTTSEARGTKQSKRNT